jgi:hypothetical protein
LEWLRFFIYWIQILLGCFIPDKRNIPSGEKIRGLTPRMIAKQSVEMSEDLNYAADLTSMIGGRLVMEFDHY